MSASEWVDRCYVGDVRDGLRAFIDAVVRAQTCICSPPYWGLRDYGTAQWDGGDAACDHIANYGPPLNKSTLTSAGIGATPDGAASKAHAKQYRDICGKCSATRIDRQIGLEPTPDEYVATMVEVFRLVRDVLADDGTLWLNLGDSYAGVAARSVKPKDLVGIPWRVAFALQADGWYLRSDIIWHKPNPMPESVTDRPTKAHEYLFLLTKSERYFYDAAAIAEQGTGRTTGNKHVKGAGMAGFEIRDGLLKVADVEWHERNRRTVWTIATEPYADAHFATFPTALVEPCVLAGSRVGDIVLDPFMGSGTVAQVAQSLGRQWIGCELNREYAAMQKHRAAQLGMAFA